MAGVKGKAGRKRVPVAEKKRAGTYRKDRHGSDLVKAPGGKIICPSWLDAAGKRHFRATVKLLREVPGLLARIDQDALAQYASAWSDFLDAWRVIEEQGAEIEDRFGCLKANPAVRRRNNAADTIRRLLVEFGMTPSARAGLKLEQGEEQDAMEEFLMRRMVGDG